MEVPALNIFQVLIPIVLPMIIGVARKYITALEGPKALWANLVLNVIGQIVVGIADPVTAVGLGVAGGLAGSGGASAVKSATKKKAVGG